MCEFRLKLKFVPRDPIYNIPALVQIMVWRRSGDKPLSKPMMVRLPTHICVTRNQWVKSLSAPSMRLTAFYVPTRANQLNRQLRYSIMTRLSNLKAINTIPYAISGSRGFVRCCGIPIRHPDFVSRLFVGGGICRQPSPRERYRHLCLGKCCQWTPVYQDDVWCVVSYVPITWLIKHYCLVVILITNASGSVIEFSDLGVLRSCDQRAVNFVI